MALPMAGHGSTSATEPGRSAQIAILTHLLEEHERSVTVGKPLLTDSGAGYISQQLDCLRSYAAEGDDTPLATGQFAAAARYEMLELAREFERIRAAYAVGDDRTVKMEAVATKMRLLGLACHAYLREFAHSASPGDRLAAVSILEVQPHAEFLTWLAERLGSEPAFVGYHAAVALRAAVRHLATDDTKRLWEAIELAGNAVASVAESNRARVVKQARNELLRIVGN